MMQKTRTAQRVVCYNVMFVMDWTNATSKHSANDSRPDGYQLC
jgi:D-mannonate dehydratase